MHRQIVATFLAFRHLGPLLLPFWWCVASSPVTIALSVGGMQISTARSCNPASPPAAPASAVLSKRTPPCSAQVPPQARQFGKRREPARLPRLPHLRAARARLTPAACDPVVCPAATITALPGALSRAPLPISGRLRSCLRLLPTLYHRHTCRGSWQTRLNKALPATCLGLIATPPNDTLRGSLPL